MNPHLAWGDTRAQIPGEQEPFKEWLQSDGTPCASFYRIASGYLVRFPDAGDFEIARDGSAVKCHPLPGAKRETCLHLYRNQVLPLMLSRRGHLVLHGSAVEIEGGAAAFVAESGRGKSTLAASFATSGHRYLSDDGLLVVPTDGGFLAQPGHPHIRLWQDSEAALVGGAAKSKPTVQYTPKASFSAESEMVFCREPLVLKCAFFLGEGVPRSPTLVRMKESAALTALIRNSFLLEPDEMPALASFFDRMAALANGLPCYQLDYPRRFEDLPRVRRAVIEQSRKAA